MTTDKLPEPGTNQQGERYNDLPTGAEDFPDPTRLDLGQTSGSGEGVGEDAPLAESPVESLPNHISSGDEWERKFGGERGR